jgi:hypothetical protein
MSERQTQPERTRLAWRRTVLAGAVVALLLARLAVTHGAWPVAPIAAAVWAVGAVTAQERIARLRPPAERSPRSSGRNQPAGPGPPPVGAPLPTAVLVVVGYAVLGLALVLVG